ncbi:phosphoribosyltransferase family protein [Streptomyces phyllanthi]|uniref:Adenine phosphoribosyltransferase n=1 Tax=Streptomyces phyllanthi TaxID=1803180 RepID=A0A5N8VUN1_9ACTN|nr:phosphoribosyltransferase family protein [Streptomyces phyllanthi]MPY38967.1 adenine phosphoribosyltransferase [Streptomyces phyllanthi]
MLRDVYRKAGVLDTGSYLTTVNELCDQLPALRPELLWYVASHLRARVDLNSISKILVEEDKGAPIGTAVSLLSGLPLAMARHYTYAFPSLRVDFSSEYDRSTLHVNGIVAGDRVCIVDDTLSTGGTVAALVRAVRAEGATVEHVAVVVEKAGNGGRELLEDELGVAVHSLLSIKVVPDGVHVLEGIA